jgi:hypothetical protein
MYRGKREGRVKMNAPSGAPRTDAGGVGRERRQPLTARGVPIITPPAPELVQAPNHRLVGCMEALRWR